MKEGWGDKKEQRTVESRDAVNGEIFLKREKSGG